MKKNLDGKKFLFLFYFYFIFICFFIKYLSKKFKRTPYNVMLNMTDVQTGINKFYRMQIIKSKGEYYFFISWGRIGKDTVGDNRLYEKDSREVKNYLSNFYFYFILLFYFIIFIFF